jgi:hypothetical protein
MVPGEEDRPFWSRTAFAIVVLPVLAFVFNWPYLMGGFGGDDVIFLNLMDQDPLPYSRWQGVWSTSDYPFLDNLWWMDWKNSSMGGIFWRPIPSLVIEGSVHLFGKVAFPLHVLSILLHGGIAVLLYLLVRRLSGRHGLALLAGLFFVACEDHSMVVGWISTIPDPLCVLFIMMALLCHAKWLKHRNPAAMAGALLALAAAMVCKETASIAPVAMVLLTLFMPGGADESIGDRTGLKQRMARGIRDYLSWLPAVLVLIAYLGIYKAMGLGDINTLVYINPLANPAGFLAHMVPHLPVLWLGTFTPIPPFATMLVPGWLVPMAILGLVVFLAYFASLWPLLRKPFLLWALVFYLVSLLPQVGTDASERGLYFPMVSAAFLLAALAAGIGPRARPKLSRWTRVMGWVALLGILCPGVLLSAAMPWLYMPGFSKPERELRTALPHIEDHEPEHVLILNASSMMLNIYTWDTLNHLSDRPQDVWILSAAHGVFSLERTGESSFTIRTDRAGWLDNIFVRMFRTSSRLKPGRRYETAIFTATLEKLTKSKGDVLAVRFDLERPLDDPGWLFLYWNGEAFVPMDIASRKIGEPVELADTSDLWKAMF